MDGMSVLLNYAKWYTRGLKSERYDNTYHVGAEQHPSQCAVCVPGTRLLSTFTWFFFLRDIIRRPTLSTVLLDRAFRMILPFNQSEYLSS